jgi:hypothetical protein
MPQASTIERSGKAAGLSLAALVLLGTRFTQGFIFWGGATRRLIYDFHSVDGVDKALKLDFDTPGFVAAKLTHALPGALWVNGRCATPTSSSPRFGCGPSPSLPSVLGSCWGF